MGLAFSRRHHRHSFRVRAGIMGLAFRDVITLQEGIIG